MDFSNWAEMCWGGAQYHETDYLIENGHAQPVFIHSHNFDISMIGRN